MQLNLPLVGSEGELERFRALVGRPGGGCWLIGGEPGAGKSRLLEAMLAESGIKRRAVLLRCTGSEPLSDLLQNVAPDSVVLVDDLHLAGPAALQGLRRLVGPGRAPSWVVAASRTAELRPGGPLAELMPYLMRLGAWRSELPRLDAIQVEALARAAGQAHLARQAYTWSEGVPLYVAARMSSPDDAVPPQVADMIAGLLAGLSEGEIALLRTAAVIGVSFDFDLLVSVSGAGEESALSGVERAVARGLLRETDSGFAFAQRPVREALCAGMIRPRRLRLHRRIAEVSDSPDAAAWHLGLAGAPEAVPLLLDAAKRAMRSGERGQAAAYGELAMSVATDTDPTRGELALLLHAALPEGELWLEEAHRSALASGDQTVALLAQQRLAAAAGDRAPRLLDTVHKALSDRWADPRLAELQEALTGRRAHQRGASDSLARAYLETGRPDVAESLLREGITEAGPYPGELDHWLLAETSLLRGELDGAFGHWRLSLEDALQRRNWPAALLRAAIWLDHLVLLRGTEQGQLAEVADEVQRIFGRACDAGGLGLLGARGPVLALWYRDGDLEQVRHEADSMTPLAIGPWIRYYRQWGARAALAERRWQEAGERLAPDLPAGGPGAVSRYGEYRSAMTAMTQKAMVCLEGGEPQAARAWLETVDAWAAGPRPSEWNLAVNRVVWSRYHLDAGDWVAAEQAAQEALAFGQRCGATTGLVLPAHLALGALPVDRAQIHRDAAAALAGQAGKGFLHQLPATVRNRPAHGLTAREVEVARLVAEGLSDKEVAGRLVISPRTVDGHLRNVFNKLDLTSRASLVAWVLRNLH